MAVGEVEEVASFGCIVVVCGCDGGGVCQIGGGEDNVDNDNDGESDVRHGSVDFDFDSWFWFWFYQCLGLMSLGSQFFISQCISMNLN